MAGWTGRALRIPFLRLLIALHVVAAVAGEVDKEAGTRKFRTEPDFYPETFNITLLTHDTDSLSPGYIFIAPLAKFFDWGPQIYDTDGNLVFYGDAVPGVHNHVEDFKVCDYLGERGTHLCLHDGEKRGTIGGINPEGRKAFFDSTYTQVGRNYTYPTPHNHTYPNSHEFQPVGGGASFLEALYRPINADLTPYLGIEDGWLWDACFFEIDVLTGDALFEWCYLDHHPVWETNLFLEAPGSPNNTSPKAGGGNFGWPWDPLHLNAVDRNAEGDYLVSIRHLDQVLKIAGNHNPQGLRPGATVWRLGGKSNDFDMGALAFSKQHSVRAVSVGAEEETFSIFDNAWEGTNTPSAKVSAGKVITVNNASMTARGVAEYPHPHGRLAESQGNMQTLGNGNVMIGWGFLPQMTEFAGDGAPLWHASFDKDDQRSGFSYRTFKSEWVGRPHWKPKVLAYAASCRPTRRRPLVVYVSHNGATEVRRWRFHLGASPRGPWLPAGTFDKRGFETRAVLSGAFLPSFMPHVRVQALDAAGRVLDSASAAVFVPDRAGASRTRKCDADGCPIGFDYAVAYSCADACGTSYLPVLPPVLLLFIMWEVLSYAGQYATACLASASRPERPSSNGGARSGRVGPKHAKRKGFYQA